MLKDFILTKYKDKKEVTDCIKALTDNASIEPLASAVIKYKDYLDEQIDIFPVSLLTTQEGSQALALMLSEKKIMVDLLELLVGDLSKKVEKSKVDETEDDDPY